MSNLKVQSHRLTKLVRWVLIALTVLLMGAGIGLADVFLPAAGHVLLAWLQGIFLPIAVYHWSNRKDLVGHALLLIALLFSALLASQLYHAMCGWVQDPTFVARFGTPEVHCILAQNGAIVCGGFWTSLFPAAMMSLIVWYGDRQAATLLLPRYNHFVDSPIRQVAIDAEAKRADRGFGARHTSPEE